MTIELALEFDVLMYPTAEDVERLARRVEEADMGRITTILSVSNRGDEVLTERNLLPADQVRRVTLSNVLVDTGATTLCLPADVIQKLGLPVLKETVAATARGLVTVRTFEDARIELMGRKGTFECLELPGGEDALLGVIPLEALGIELDLQKQELRLLSESGSRTYITIYQMGPIRRSPRDRRSGCVLAEPPSRTPGTSPRTSPGGCG